MDDVFLRAKVRAAIKRRKFPRRSPDRTLVGGPGVGAECVICGVPVRADETEFEIQFARDGSGPGFDTYHMHIRCFAAWELERQSA